MRLCWGEENLGNALIRRLNSDEGCLASIGDDPDYGYNLANHVNASFDRARPGALAAVGGRSRTELEKDVRVDQARTRIIAGGDSLAVYAELATESGPFSLVVGVSDITVDRLNRGLPGVTPTGDL
jgi:hypothetical protein